MTLELRFKLQEASQVELGTSVLAEPTASKRCQDRNKCGVCLRKASPGRCEVSGRRREDFLEQGKGGLTPGGTNATDVEVCVSEMPTKVLEWSGWGRRQQALPLDCPCFRSAAALQVGFCFLL